MAYLIRPGMGSSHFQGTSATDTVFTLQSCSRHGTGLIWLCTSKFCETLLSISPLCGLSLTENASREQLAGSEFLIGTGLPVLLPQGVFFRPALGRFPLLMLPARTVVRESRTLCIVTLSGPLTRPPSLELRGTIGQTPSGIQQVVPQTLSRTTLRLRLTSTEIVLR